MRPWLGRSLGEGKGYPLQYSGLDNSIDCIVYGVTKSQTWLSDFILYGLSHNFEYSSLFYTVGPCSSILNVIVCIYQPQTPSPCLFLPSSPWKPNSVLCVYESVSVLQRGSFVLYFKIPHVSDIIWCFVFFWVTSLSMIIFSCIHVAANGIASFFFLAE